MRSELKMEPANNSFLNRARMVFLYPFDINSGPIEELTVKCAHKKTAFVAPRFKGDLIHSAQIALMELHSRPSSVQHRKTRLQGPQTRKAFAGKIGFREFMFDEFLV